MCIGYLQGVVNVVIETYVCRYGSMMDVITLTPLNDHIATNGSQLYQVNMNVDIIESVQDGASAETVQVRVENKWDQVSRQDST